MKFHIKSVRPNPFRDFDLNPHDEGQIEKLRPSIREDGMHATLPARYAPDCSGAIELAAGHNRLRAQVIEGRTEVDLTIHDYSDRQMVRVMTKENVLQNGHTAASSLDSVAAHVSLLVHAAAVVEAASDRAEECAILSEAGALTRPDRATITGKGPTIAMISRLVNGEGKGGEVMKSPEIAGALSRLRMSGSMDVIIESALARASVDVGTAIDVRRVPVVEVPVYDIRCDQRFRTPIHAQAFADAVTSDDGKRVLTVSDQLAFAESVRAQIDGIERRRRHTVGSMTVEQVAREHMADAVRASDRIAGDERAALLDRHAKLRVVDRWGRLSRYAAAFDSQLDAMLREMREWDAALGAFPIADDRIEAMVDSLERVKTLRDALTGGGGLVLDAQRFVALPTPEVRQ